MMFATLVRSLTPEMLAWCAGSGRFLFHKDTSVYTDTMLKKLAAVQAVPNNTMKLVIPFHVLSEVTRVFLFSLDFLQQRYSF